MKVGAGADAGSGYKRLGIKYCHYFIRTGFTLVMIPIAYLSPNWTGDILEIDFRMSEKSSY